jgi:tetratricopeptide (TPR) repeat protein/chitodextrinase
MKATIPAGVEADEPLAVAKFMTHGYLKEDASDVRVIGRGREVPSRVLCVGPGDEVTIAFQLLVGVEAYQVYYGKAKAAPAAYDWKICAGLLMEVKKFPGGPCNNLQEALALWQKSRDVMGADFVPRIFFGYNPFGPSDSFLAHYTGWLRVEKPGRYEFATTSSHASFLLIDGKEVVSWPGWHPAAHRARHQGSVDLKSGRHQIEYYHVHAGGEATAVAAWTPPGEGRPDVIPAQAFLPVARATVQPEQVYDQPVTPDFDTRRSEAFLDPDANSFLYRWSFRDLTSSIDRKYYRPLWDFGDGTAANVWTASHVYLAPGVYTVTYTLKGVQGSFTTKQRIAVERDWSQQASSASLETLDDYYPVVSTYDFRKMPAESLRAACEMFDRLRKYEDLERVSRVLLFETERVSDAGLMSETERLARVYLDRRRDVKSAVEVYLNGEKRVSVADWKAVLLVRAAALVLGELSDIDRARGYYRRVLDLYKAAKPETRRRALMGLAEVAVFSGDAKEAGRLLGEADAVPVRKSEQGGAAVRVGSLSRAVEDYIRRNEFTSARDLLDEWEWEYPLDRLVGYSTVLRARLQVRRGEYPQAIRLLSSLVQVNPRSNYAAEALMGAAECYLSLGDKPKARDTYKRVLGEYPESPFVKTALTRLEEIK